MVQQRCFCIPESLLNNQIWHQENEIQEELVTYPKSFTAILKKKITWDQWFNICKISGTFDLAGCKIHIC